MSNSRYIENKIRKICRLLLIVQSLMGSMSAFCALVAPLVVLRTGGIGKKLNSWKLEIDEEFHGRWLLFTIEKNFLISI